VVSALVNSFATQIYTCK